RDPGRDRVLVAGDRPGRVRGGRHARLPDAPGGLPRPDVVGRVLQLHRRPDLLPARPEDHRMKAAEPALARGTALEARPSAGGSPVIQVLRERRSALLGFFIVAFFIVLAIVGPSLAPYSSTVPSGPVYAPPSSQHLLGTDGSGVDVLSEMMYGGRTSLIVGFAAALVAVIVGGGIGLLAGYRGGGTDVALMRITDYFLVIPDLVLMIVVATVFGPSLSHVILVIGLLLWTTTARIVRAQVKSIRERVYVKRARSLGASHRRIVA